MTFGRLLTAMITPFNHEGEVDYGSAERLADHLINTGTEAIVLCGTTGESPTLTWEEEYELFRVVRQAVGVGQRSSLAQVLTPLGRLLSLRRKPTSWDWMALYRLPLLQQATPSRVV